MTAESALYTALHMLSTVLAMPSSTVNVLGKLMRDEQKSQNSTLIGVDAVTWKYSIGWVLLLLVGQWQNAASASAACTQD